MERKLDPKKFFTADEETKIIDAIKQAEKNTSGEIRLHLTREIKKDPMKEAVRIFNHLKMHKTAARNGCLILLGLKSKKIVVIGDKGINEKVGENFWQDVVDIMTENFKKEDYAIGLSSAIIRIGEKLKAFFPYQSDDVNELSDEISKDEI